MKHLAILEHGKFLGVTGARLTVSAEGRTVREIPLSRLRTIFVGKTGVGFSGALALECAGRGIRVFFTDFRGRIAAALVDQHQHAVVEIRRAQFKAADTPVTMETARAMAYGKLRNQRALLLYFSKGAEPEAGERLKAGAARLEAVAESLMAIPASADFRDAAMGCEGAGASAYFEALRESGLLPPSFTARIGRGALEPVNAALNYGYAILQSYVWNAVINAGMEPYEGVLHARRPGKPSLVLDLMEEFRAWVVDRQVIRLRPQLGREKEGGLSLATRRLLTERIQESMAARHPWRNRRLHLESIVQRQAWRLAAAFCGEKPYKAYLFKW